MLPLNIRALKEGLSLQREGVFEHGWNTGPKVDSIIRYAEGQVGEPWCVDFCIWCYGKTGSSVLKPGAPRAVTALLGWPGVYRTYSPKPGALVRFLHPGVEHVGMLIGWRRWGVRCPRRFATHAYTVEGNTDPSNAVHTDGGNGRGGVYLKLRPISYVTDYLEVTR